MEFIDDITPYVMALILFLLWRCLYHVHTIVEFVRQQQSFNTRLIQASEIVNENFINMLKEINETQGRMQAIEENSSRCGYTIDSGQQAISRTTTDQKLNSQTE